MGHALKRRTTIIPFKFSPPNPDDDLKVKLLEELSGIFFWALVILQEAKKYHFAQMDTEMEKAGWTVDQLRSALKQALEELGWEQYRKRWSWLDILTTPIRQK